MRKHLLLTLGLIACLAPAVQANQAQLAASIKEARAEAARTADQLKITLDAVTALTKQKEGDLLPAYRAFAAEVPKTQAAATWTRTRVQWMNSDGQRYFESWQRTVDSLSSDSLRKKAQKRIDSVKKSYDKVSASLAQAGEKFGPFLSNLEDIQKILSKDVTPGGVKAIRGTVRDANWNHNTVKSAVSDALKEMDKMAKALSTEVK